MAGLIGAFITSIYTFRMVFVTFFGVSKTDVSYRPGLRITLPLIVLAFLSLGGGFVELPDTLGSLHLFSDLLKTVFSERGVEYVISGKRRTVPDHRSVRFSGRNIPRAAVVSAPAWLRAEDQ